MKRLLVYLAVMVGCLFVGLTTYYMIKNNETIIIDAPKAYSDMDAIYLNVGESSTLSITHTLKKTELSHTLSEENVVAFDMKTGKIVALNGGETQLTITSGNEKYKPFVFTIKVGDGATNSSPYYIKTEEDLKAIGGTRKYGEVEKTWSNSANYAIVSDIELDEESEWKPLCPEDSFTGTLNGNFHTISNFKMTKQGRYAGLFAMIGELAEVHSITFKNPVINGRYDFAGIVSAMNKASKISMITVKNASIKVAPFDTNLPEAKQSTCFVGGIVGAIMGSYTGMDESTVLYDNATIETCTFQGTIATADNVYEVVGLNKYTLFNFGGITGFNKGATIFNNKADVKFSVNESVATLANGYNRNTSGENGVCFDLGGIVGAVGNANIFVDPKDETTQIGTIYPIVKNNLALVQIDNKTTTSNGIVGHVPLDVQKVDKFDGTPAAQRIVGNYFYSANASVKFGGSGLACSTTSVSANELKAIGTYKSSEGEYWSIGDTLSVWIMRSDGIPEINPYGMSVTVNFDQDKYVINDILDFMKYYSKMISATDSVKRYWLRQNYVLNKDLVIDTSVMKNWMPIGAEQFAFSGTFDGNGKTITFKNVKFVNTKEKYIELAGFFGQIAPNAEVKDLTIVGFEVNYGKYTGTIAGVNYGKITDCCVKESKLNNSLSTGFFVGVNYGVVTSTKTIETSVGEGENAETITSPASRVLSSATAPCIETNVVDKKVYAGGIAGFNFGTISKVKLEGSSQIQAKIATTKGSIRYLGGLVGYNYGTLEDCYVESGNVYDYSTVAVYLGGIAGANSGTITKCSTGTKDQTTCIYASLEEGNQIAGGLVGVLTEEAKISQSFGNVNIECRTVGGFSPYLFGTVKECYIGGLLKGKEVGGFAVHMARSEASEKGGYICDAYTTASLTAINENSILAGLSVYMRYPAKIEKCVMSSSFSGDTKEQYYESFTNTREGFMNWVTSWANKDQRLGTITKVIINTTPTGKVNEQIKSTKAVVSYAGQVVKYLTNEELLDKGQDTLVQLGFNVASTTGWTAEKQEMPYLTSLEGLHGVSQITSLV
ncbi:MAG: hypothetical protein SO085_03810 [Eubacteriales bacterium]|nr:hypothetical protein [Eubacteriales bacterium]